MSWVKVDDHLHGHPKTVAAGNEAMGLWVRVQSWCGAYLTDGFCPHDQIRSFCRNEREANRLTEALVRAGYWSVDNARGGIISKNYLDYNPSRAEIDADRISARDRKRRQRMSQVESQGLSRRDSSVTPASVTDAVTVGVTAESGMGSVSVSESGSSAHARCTPQHVQDCWQRATGNIVAAGLTDVAILCEQAAPVQVPPMEPDEYAEVAISAFVRWAKQCPPGKQPQLAPFKFVAHFARVQEWVKKGRVEPKKTAAERLADKAMRARGDS